MDETTRQVLQRVKVPTQTPVVLADGRTYNYVFNMKEISPNDLARIAAVVAGYALADCYDIAIGIYPSGVFFAGAVGAGRTVGILGPGQSYFGPEIKGKDVVLVEAEVTHVDQFLTAAQLVSASGGVLKGCVTIVDYTLGKANTLGTKYLWAFQP